MTSSSPSTPAPTLAELTDLTGKTAVVTGAAKGIGLAISRRLIETGARVIMIDIDEGEMRRAVDELGTERAVALTVDVTNTPALSAALDKILPAGNTIDIWINNAGIAPRQPILEITAEDWEKVMSLNLTAALCGAQIAARRMIDAEKGGVIINIVSSTVHRVSANPAHYRASKAGLKALTENLAVDLGRHGIRVLAVAPGLTETPQVEKLRNAGASEGLDIFVRRLPLQRIGSPDEIARVVLFAATGLANFMTGCVITADGGESVK